MRPILSSATWLFCLAMFALSLLWLGYFPINEDNGVHVLIADHMLQGKRLYEDLIMINFPFQDYVRMPALWLADRVGWSWKIASHVQSYLLLFLAFGLVLRLLPEVFRDAARRNRIAAALAFLYFLFPSLLDNQFAQKEHLIFAFVLPYLLLALARVKGRPIGKVLAVSVGVIAALSCYLKPHYALLIVAMEFYLMFATRRLMGWVRVEGITVLAMGALYVVSLAEVWQAYVENILPLSGVYAAFDHSPPALAHASLLYFLLVFPTFYRGRWFYKGHFARLLLLLSLLSLGIGLMQHKGWMYHFLVAYGFGALLLAHYLFLLRDKAVEKVPEAPAFRQGYYLFLTWGALLSLALGLSGVQKAGARLLVNEQFREYIAPLRTDQNYFLITNYLWMWVDSATALKKNTSSTIYGTWVFRVAHEWGTREGQGTPYLVEQQERFYRRYVESIRALEPEYLFVDVPGAGGKNAYIEAFLERPEMQEILKKYRLLETPIALYGQPVLRVYQKRALPAA